MHVCFLTGEYPPMEGGVADHTANLAHHLAESGCRISVLTSVKARGAARADGNIRVFPIVSRWAPSFWQHIGLFLAAHQPDVLHIQYQAAAFDLTGWVNWLPRWLRLMSSLRALSRRPRLVVTFHDLRVPYLFPKAGRWRWKAILALASGCDGVITTNAQDELALNQYSWAAGRVHRIPLGSNVDPQLPAGYTRDGWRARLGIEPSQFLLGYFGFLNASKGGEELVLAMDGLVESGVGARLLMIGGQVGDVDPTNQAYSERVAALMLERHLTPRVTWTGHVAPEEVSAHLKAVDVMVMLYRDGVSFRRTTLISALRHGCPVLTTRPDWPLPEILPGQNMELVAPGDVAGAAEALARLAADPEHLSSLARGALELGRIFDWSHIADQTLRVYSGEEA